MASVPLPVRAACAAVVLSCVFSSRPVFATDEPADEPLSQVVISASRAIGGVPRALLDASVTVLEAADLRERQVRFVADVLRDVPGVSVSQAGPAGSVTQVAANPITRWCSSMACRLRTLILVSLISVL